MNNSIQIATHIIEVLIKFSPYIEKNANRFQVILSLCYCFLWLDDIPPTYEPTVPIYHALEFKYWSISDIAKIRNNLNKNNNNNNNNNNEMKGDENDELLDVVPPLLANQLMHKVEKNTLGGDDDDDGKIVFRKLFEFANKCLECISQYAKHSDVQSLLTRAILPKVTKSQSFMHKKYLLHAGMFNA